MSFPSCASFFIRCACDRDGAFWVSSIGLVLAIKLHGRGCIVECSQQILLHIPYRCGTFRKTLQHKADMVCIQLHESAAHDLRGLVIPCTRSILRFEEQVSTRRFTI